MGVWDKYQSRINAHGGSKYNAAYKREVRYINSKLPDNLSYFTVDIYPREYGFNIESNTSIQNKLSQDVAIVDSDNLDEKTIYSMPSEDIELGALVYWMNSYWLVYERDLNTTLYTKAKLLLCNHLLKWIDSENNIISQWCVVEDGTKYLTGEQEDRNFFTTRGDARISLQIAKNEYTSAFGRSNRFLIDDDDSPHKMSFLLTKPLKTGSAFSVGGTFKFVLQEVTATEFDNHELGIADYYHHFPKVVDDNIESGKTEDSKDEQTDGKKVWI